MLRQIGPGVQVIEIIGPARDALRYAVKEGIELLHLVADGIVSLAYDGVLYVHDAGAHQLSATELSSLLSGSRVALLSLSVPEDNFTPDTMMLTGRVVPSAFRAFAYLASVSLPLPSIAVPLGPMPPFELSSFWRAFYNSLGESLAVDTALLSAQVQLSTGAPVALFSRHAYGTLFRRSLTTFPAAEFDPSQVSLSLQVSRTAVAAMDALTREYQELLTFTPSVSAYVSAETNRQQSLKAMLLPWQQLEGDER